jgi:hypothetical protein
MAKAVKNPKFGKIYRAAKHYPSALFEHGVLLVYYDKISTWLIGHYSNFDRKYVTDAPVGCKALFWTPMPPQSISGIVMLATV